MRLYTISHLPKTRRAKKNVTNTAVYVGHQLHSVLAQGSFGRDLKMCHFCMLLFHFFWCTCSFLTGVPESLGSLKLAVTGEGMAVLHRSWTYHAPVSQL